MSIKKQFNEKKQTCKVTFTLAKEISNFANRINLVGDFNDWNIENIPMRKNKSREFYASVNLQKGREYEFKYLINGDDWLNESEADMFKSNAFLSYNSVVIV